MLSPSHVVPWDIVGPLIGVAVLVFVLVRAHKHYEPHSEPWSAALALTSLVDTYTDIALIAEAFRTGNTAIAAALIVVLSLSVFVNGGLLLRVWLRLLKDPALCQWLDGNATIASILTLLSLSNVNALPALGCKFLRLDSFSAPFPLHVKRQIEMWGALDIILEDVPQLILAGCLAYRVGATTYVTLALFSGVVMACQGLGKRALLYGSARTLPGKGAEPSSSPLSHQRASPKRPMSTPMTANKHRQVLNTHAARLGHGFGA